MLQKCYMLREKALGNECASSPIFTKWFGLGKKTTRPASDCRLLGHQWHVLPLSNRAEHGITCLVSGFVHLGLLSCGL